MFPLIMYIQIYIYLYVCVYTHTCMYGEYINNLQFNKETNTQIKLYEIRIDTARKKINGQ